MGAIALKRLSGVALSLLLVIGCATNGRAYADAPEPVASAQPTEYRIGPLDKLSINVFEVKDLSFDKVEVDASGQLVLPLIGVVQAQGKTARELSADIAQKLDATYMRDPQVSVVVVESQSQKITVEGAVTEAGVFEIHGGSSLLQAIAMARGVTKTADLGHVTLFRTVSGVRRTLSFNAKAIQAGKQEDPEVLAGDLIVVAESGSKSALQRAVDLAPALYILSILH